MAISKQAKKEKVKLELIWHLAESDPADAQHHIDHAFDVLFESVLEDSQPQPQTL